MNFPEKIFITGTGTDVGKTIISAIMAAGLNSSYWKPVQCGLDGQTDSEIVRELTGFPSDYFLPETYRLTQPLSPHASAQIDNKTIDINNFVLPSKSGNGKLIVEGAGGIMVPLNKEHYMLDLMKMMNFPIVLVASSGLGTINHTLLSIDVLRRNNLELLGVVMNGPTNISNRKALEYYGKVKILAEVDEIKDIKTKDLAEIFTDCF
jgi:dethiobiotin synthetase